MSCGYSSSQVLRLTHIFLYNACTHLYRGESKNATHFDLKTRTLYEHYYTNNLKLLSSGESNYTNGIPLLPLEEGAYFRSKGLPITPPPFHRGPKNTANQTRDEASSDHRFPAKNKMSL